MVTCVIMPELEVGAESDPWKLLAGQFSLFDELQVQLETPSKPMVQLRKASDASYGPAHVLACTQNMNLIS